MLPQSTVGDSSSTPLLALHCGLTRVGETKFSFNQLLPKCLRQSDQQLMTVAPSSNQSNHRFRPVHAPPDNALSVGLCGGRNRQGKNDFS